MLWSRSRKWHRKKILKYQYLKCVLRYSTWVNVLSELTSCDVSPQSENRTLMTLNKLHRCLRSQIHFPTFSGCHIDSCRYSSVLEPRGFNLRPVSCICETLLVLFHPQRMCCFNLLLHDWKKERRTNRILFFCKWTLYIFTQI